MGDQWGDLATIGGMELNCYMETRCKLQCFTHSSSFFSIRVNTPVLYRIEMIFGESFAACSGGTVVTVAVQVVIITLAMKFKLTF